MTKDQAIDAIRAFVAQRSGIEFGNYQSGDWKASRKAFMGDYRLILRAGRDARNMLAYVSACAEIRAEDIVKATRAYSGRLKLVERDGEVYADYCTGQYFPTEYRKAACAVLAQAIWDYAARCKNDADSIRRWAKSLFGRGIASQWFN